MTILEKIDEIITKLENERDELRATILKAKLCTTPGCGRKRAYPKESKCMKCMLKRNAEYKAKRERDRPLRMRQMANFYRPVGSQNED